MAIESLYLHFLKKAVDRRRGAGQERLRGLLLAYPDMVVPRNILVQTFGEPAVAALPQRSDAAATWEWHGLSGVTEPLFESLAIFDLLGIDATVIDAARLRGMERVVDLNLPLPQDLVRAFDIVVDTGTCEHCFNVAQAFANSCEALSANGILVHAAPLTRMNHGFWNFSPTVYADFFEDNGFEIQLLTGVTGELAQGLRPFAVDPVGRFDAPPGAMLYVVARRVQVQPFKWPVQRKYRHMLS